MIVPEKRCLPYPDPGRLVGIRPQIELQSLSDIVHIRCIDPGDMNSVSRHPITIEPTE